MTGALLEVRRLIGDAELARRLGVADLDILPVTLVDWARDFVRYGYA